ncbi:MAG: hypothetical protein COT14_03680 [Candidatus Diapherotrites archaeon CG08_land_8_20_14_0_20_30_16]|nr:MAG: hypothetical protein COT14_03680 [Candidatus Diapherotrites archaeon CG08_land_8_20_14_0_20_30_16]
MNKKAQISIFFLVLILSLIAIFLIFVDNIQKIDKVTQKLKKTFDDKKMLDLQSAINSLNWTTIIGEKKEPRILNSDKDFGSHYG